MKTLKILILFLVVVAMNGDTLLSVRQIQPCPTSCILASVGGMIEWVEGTVGEGGGSAPTWVQRVEVVAASATDWVLLKLIVPGSLDVVLNGSVLSPGEDFNLANNIVSFLGHVPGPGDVLRFKYQTP